MQTLAKNELDFTILSSTQDEIDFLNDFVDEDYKKYSEMSNQDRNFLNSLLLRTKPKKIVEIGVSKGASSGIILNAIKDVEGAHLYSVDINKNCYSLPDKMTGFYVNNYPELKKNWTLYLEGTIYDFIDKIGGDIDLCFIDTVHSNPGEILDILGILPYLKKDAIVVFHDVNLQTVDYIQATNNNLMSAITGKKIIPDNSPFIGLNGHFNNIGAIKLNENSFKNIFEIFNLLAQKWVYMPGDRYLNPMKPFYRKHYGEYYANYFENVVNFQRGRWFAPKVAYFKPNNFLQNIFSIRNHRRKEKTYKVVTILGIKFKFKQNKR